MNKKEEEFHWIPVHDDVDLGLNATNATIDTKKFTVITNVLITLQFADAAVEWTEFLAGSALTNGLFVSLDGVAITATAKTKGQLMEWGKADILAKDNDNTYVIQIELDFAKWCGNLGLQAEGQTGYRDLVVDINDDLSSLTGIFTANVKGWKIQ